MASLYVIKNLYKPSIKYEHLVYIQNNKNMKQKQDLQVLLIYFGIKLLMLTGAVIYYAWKVSAQDHKYKHSVCIEGTIRYSIKVAH